MAQPVSTKEQPDSPVPPDGEAPGFAVESNGTEPAPEPEAEAELPPGLPGNPPPLLTIISGLPTGGYPLKPGETIVGRSSDADLQFKHPEISRQHCRLHWDGGNICTIEDLGSRWGTKVNGAALSSEVRTPLEPGDRLLIGPVSVYFAYGPPPTSAGPVSASAQSLSEPVGFGGRTSPARAAEAAALPVASASLEPQVLLRGRATRVIPLRGKLTLGRADDVDVVLADPSISRQHATVEHTPTGFQVTDLRSRAGSLVNGRRFEKHQLVIGDQLQMGPFFFRFDGQALERTTGLAGVEIDARHVRKTAGPIVDPRRREPAHRTRAVRHHPRSVRLGQKLAAGFAHRPAPRRLGRHPLRRRSISTRNTSGCARVLGYVPQDDIVHRELTVDARPCSSARKLRLPAGTPDDRNPQARGADHQPPRPGGARGHAHPPAFGRPAQARERGRGIARAAGGALPRRADQRPGPGLASSR